MITDINSEDRLVQQTFVEYLHDALGWDSVYARVLLNGMLAHDRLLDLVENFIVFDDSKPGGTRKIVARNHQVLGVNNAVASVPRQEELKRQFPPERRLVSYTIQPSEVPLAAGAGVSPVEDTRQFIIKSDTHDVLPLVQRAHPDLGRLGVFWHTQGSGKSYSMAFFAEKVRRVVPGNFTFVIMTDREDLDDQIWRTFIGCGVADEQTPRASSGAALQEILQQNHRFVFSLMHKFNQEVKEPYSERDDIIVMSDEAHRTQAGRFARNMWLALPNASFIGFTGTPLFKHDHLTRRIFGGYVSRYDFKRSEEDQSTVKLGLARLDLNDRIAEKTEEADLDLDQVALLEKLLGKDYEVITAGDRLDKLADDFVEHCSTHWETGKSMLVCIDKITCARMLQRIEPRWKLKLAHIKTLIPQQEAELAAASDPDARERLGTSLEKLRGQAQWMESTIIEIIISEAQNEVRDFQKWGFDIIPHCVVMKKGFQRLDGKTVHVEDAFKDPEHPFRIAIVCAMWLTGFDVECLATLYIDKPMKAHTLMQAIARANRVYPGKDCGVIVDYNGMLKSLREALAQYALGDDHAEGLTVDLSQIDFARLRAEFAHKVQRKHTALQDIRDVVEQKLQQMLARNPMRMDYYKKYQEIIADYNREKDRVTVEETFARLVELAHSLDAEQRRAAEEGLSDDAYALFQMLFKDNLSKADRDQLKQASQSLLVSLRALLTPIYA